MVHTAFSNTSQLMFEFMSKNQRAIDALTIKDVIYGEIEDSVSKVDDIEDLLSINQVEFRCCRPRTCWARPPNSASWSTG